MVVRLLSFMRKAVIYQNLKIRGYQSYREIYLIGRNFFKRNFRRAKISLLNEKFVTLDRRKVLPNKSKSVSKWSTSKPTTDLSHLDNFDYVVGRNFVGRNFRHLSKNSSLSPDEKFRPIKAKVSQNEVQVNLRVI